MSVPKWKRRYNAQGIYGACRRELTISDLRCWILFCRLSKWSRDVVGASAGPRSVGAWPQRDWRDEFLCCQEMKNWRDKAKCCVGTDVLSTLNAVAMCSGHYIHLHQLIVHSTCHQVALFSPREPHFCTWEAKLAQVHIKVTLSIREIAIRCT
jgi:hypothetical protein